MHNLKQPENLSLSLSLSQVLLLSFSLILFPSLKPLSDTKVSEGDFSAIRSE